MANPKVNVGILLFPEIEVLDFAGPFEVFSRVRLAPGVESRRSDETAPFRVFTIAKTEHELIATGGLRVVPHFSFMNHPHIDLLVVPGGFGTRRLLEDVETLAWVRTVAKTTSLTTSVCTGSLLLAKAGLLSGLQATTHWGALDLLESIGTSENGKVQVVRNSRYVDCGNVITSAGVSSGIDMAFHIVEKMFGKEVADETAKYIEFKRRNAE